MVIVEIKRLLRFIYNFTANDVGVLKAIFTPMPLQKGTVLTYDWQYGTGTIQAHKDSLHYPFRCTSRSVYPTTDSLTVLRISLNWKGEPKQADELTKEKTEPAQGE